VPEKASRRPSKQQRKHSRSWPVRPPPAHIFLEAPDHEVLLQERVQLRQVAGTPEIISVDGERGRKVVCKVAATVPAWMVMAWAWDWQQAERTCSTPGP
jgi:hypothetical protein